MTATKTDPRAEGFAKLREPFPAEQIGVLPKPRSKDAPKGRCDVCNGWHGLPAVHLDYVGHAALTQRLLEVDPEWTWEHQAVDQFGAPILDRNGGLWIRLTVLGVTRPGYGDAQGKSGGNAVKEAIGDALRNAAMRFGCALDLWSKEDLHGAEEQRNQHDDPAPQSAPPDPLQMAKDRLAAACRTAGVAPQTVIDWAITPSGPNGGVALNVCTDPKVFDALAKRVQDGGFAEPTPDEAKAAVQGELGGTEVPS
ncbi:hypothetical protein [Tsukamurella hominis]|uniref:hypothetical protein n=1 Tax=Tsukamurella hominis TaxID=1970232 RepID=UPI0039E96955